MKLFTDWGFHPQSWNGQRGEYWALAQGVLLGAFALLPTVRLVALPPSPWLYGLWALAGLCAIAATGLILRGLVDLGANLTPLPHPKTDSTLVQTGIYGIVRHPLYSGILFGTLAWALWQFSLTHFLGYLVLLVFFDAKARREEKWLSDKFPEYTDYQQRVKKLIPWLY